MTQVDAIYQNGVFRGETVLVSGHPLEWSEQCTYHDFGAEKRIPSRESQPFP